MSTADEVLAFFDQNGIDEEIALLVLAALNGQESLDSALSGQPIAERSEAGATDGPAVQNIYLSSIEVAGFRGIGPAAHLNLAPGPGLTIVAGRNGSGKSSFADALEVLLTGDSWRWKGKSAVWKQGWRNLHQADDTRVEAKFLVEEKSGSTRVWRTWDAQAKDASDADTRLQSRGEKQSDLIHSGWADQVSLYRPLLSHTELGVVADNPSSLFDALASVLDVDELVAGNELLRQTRIQLQKGLKETKKQLKEQIQPELDDSDDPRASEAAAALAGSSWDLDTVERLSSGESESEPDLAALQQVAQLKLPATEDIENLGAVLEQASLELQQLEAGEAGRSHKLAQLLELALAEHTDHNTEECPVCGVGCLDSTWEQTAQQQLADLRDLSLRYDAAANALKEALGETKSVLNDPRLDVPKVDLNTDSYHNCLKLWRSGPEAPGQAALHLRAAHPELLAAGQNLAAAAEKELEARRDAWRPTATALTSWAHRARQAIADNELSSTVKAAEDALGPAIADIRNKRFAPIADQAIALWESLRLQSSVQLKGVELTGSGTRRRVALQVTVDNTEGAALGVVSQGEVNCLALSLFFPRVMLPDNPFRFIVIDDPIQAMDPSRVDGLARVFSEVAQDRQLVVFTHDDRLPDALRRLGLPHTLLQVTRRPESHVEVRSHLDPVEQYFLDARAVAKDDDLPDGVASRVVPGFCRLGIESACMETVRRRRLGDGQSHQDVEDVLSRAGTTELAALALFDDPTAGGKVIGEINRQVSAAAANAFRDSKLGAHKGFSGSLESLINESLSLAERLRRMK